ncbi:MAG: peptidoglycan-binding protein, partial [Rhodobacteraceae bacterium]|nr:peptidoglycan-binding protein [Paracoccaceae bacterium]
MSTLPKIQIDRSVGHRAQNNIADVRKVQIQLNLLLDPGRTSLVEDGFYGPNTKEMIGDFQSKVLGFQFPDHRVDPGA